MEGFTERKLFEYKKFETSITRLGITLFFNAACTNNYHKNFDKRISYRKRNGTALFTKRLGNVFDETESITYLPAHFLTYSAQKTNCLFPITNDSNPEINDLAERKNDSSTDTNGFAEWKCDSAAIANDLAELENSFADVTNGSAALKNDFAGVTNDFAEVRNDFAELRNGFADHKNPLFSLINEVFRVKSAILTGKAGMGSIGL